MNEELIREYISELADYKIKHIIINKIKKHDIGYYVEYKFKKDGHITFIPFEFLNRFIVSKRREKIEKIKILL